MTASAEAKRLVRQPPKPGLILALGFLLLILCGGMLLALPVASATGRSLGLLKGMFTATSAVCVTGLTIVDAGVELSGFGQAILLVLIQMGGLGFMVFATLSMVLLGRRISLKSRMLIGESMNFSGLSGAVRLTLVFSGLAIGIELLGAAVLCARFIPLYGAGQGIWYSVFHSVSAFCNAGFDLFGRYESLIGFRGDGLVLVTLGLLIILGGLGFSVIIECFQQRARVRRLSLHSKLVLISTGALIALGWLLTCLLEWNNPDTLGAEGMTAGARILNGFFQSVTFRTAGFAAVDQAALNDTTKLAGLLWMLVGASPASTGGGLKTTTVAVVLLLVVAVIRGHERITLFGKEISQDTARRAVAVSAIAVAFLFLVTCAISVLERHSGIPMLDLAFETTSAISTTGLSSLGTPALRVGSQILLMPLMYLGRVGPLTLAAALARRSDSAVRNRVRHPEEKIMIG